MPHIYFSSPAYGLRLSSVVQPQLLPQHQGFKGIHHYGCINCICLQYQGLWNNHNRHRNVHIGHFIFWSPWISILSSWITKHSSHKNIWLTIFFEWLLCLFLPAWKFSHQPVLYNMFQTLVWSILCRSQGQLW